MLQKLLLLLPSVLGLLLLLALFPTTTLAQICPPAEAVAPCSCYDDDGAGSLLICETSEGQDIDLKAVFDRITPLVDQSAIFDFLTLTHLPPSVRNFPAHLTSLKFRQIQIDANPELEYIHPEAFNGSYETTTTLIVHLNKLSNSKGNQSDNFKFFAQFPNLEWLWVREMFLEYIPSDPWPLLPNLRTMSLDLCGLVGVGSRIFANLPNLATGQLKYCNNMSLDGFDVDAFEGLAPGVELDLRESPIPYLPQAIFQPALDSAKRVEIGRWLCDPFPPYCDYERLSCDEAARWLCNNETAYRPKLFGFRCDTTEEEDDDYDVWDWCRDNPSH